jgi:glycosyltransferase involved in cell wall biosynthesis
MRNLQSHIQDESPFISFIIPAYNLPPELLRECIESILALSLRPTERQIIVVDDGSAEPLINVLTDFADQLLYIRQPNQGVSAARNQGLLVAKGQYIQFIDGDDMLLRTDYEHVLDLARFEKTDIVMFNFTESPIAKDGGKYDDHGPLTGSELMRQQNIQGAVWLLLFRNAIRGSLAFTPGIRYGEDEEFTPQMLLRAERVITTSAKPYYYRLRPTSATNSIDIRSRLTRLNDTYNVITSLQKRLDTLPTEERIALQRRVDQLTMDYIHNIIVFTQNMHYLDRKLNTLRQQGLFPLPDRDYTTTYKWFRRMTNSRIGLMMLMRVLPRISK